MRFHLSPRSPRWGRRLLTAVALAWASGAAADVQVTKTDAGVLVVEAHNATVRQVLEALSASHPIVFRDSPALSRVITGTYSGTFGQVLSRVLDGYDRVIQLTATGAQLDIVGPEPSNVSVAQAAPAVVTRMPPNIGGRVSTNVDLDEEKLAKTAGTGNGSAPARPVARVSAPPQQPRMVHGFLDLDGELTQ